MRVLSFRIFNNAAGYTVGFTHRAEGWVDGRPHTFAECGITHDESTDYMDCPVASRWTLLRVGT